MLCLLGGLNNGMSKVELVTERDKSTGRFLPGHSASSTDARAIATNMARLKAIWVSCVTEEDVRKCHEEHLKCINQDKDMKVKLAAIALLYDRLLGKAEQHISVQSENTNRTLNANLNVSAEQQAVLEAIVKQNTLEASASANDNALSLPVADVSVEQ